MPVLDDNGNFVKYSRCHATLFRVRYNDKSCHGSILLYIKASLTKDESADIKHYHTTHPEFPHEATGDQFFDESQWESYRALGEHIGVPLFCSANPDWFWRIPVTPLPGVALRTPGRAFRRCDSGDGSTHDASGRQP